LILESQHLIYFLSDAHLGTPDHESSLVREKKLVAFLDEIKGTASDIFFMGDLFDFWFEYKKVVPRGFTRILGKIAELADQGIRVHYFTGNHDIWMFDYLPVRLASSYTGILQPSC
jgi:UDP-2,3-diacylglucosamine hydrolase